LWSSSPSYQVQPRRRPERQEEHKKKRSGGWLSVVSRAQRGPRHGGGEDRYGRSGSCRRTLPTLPAARTPPSAINFFWRRFPNRLHPHSYCNGKRRERERERGKVTWRSAVQLPLGAKMASRRGTGLSGRRRILRRAFKVDGTIECEIDSLSPPQAQAEATAGAAEPEMKGKMAAVVVLCHGQWSSKYGAWPVPVCRPAGASP